LAGQSTSWRALRDDSYPHPELGLLYVFGHHDVYDCNLSFGPLAEGRIALHWQGLCRYSGTMRLAKVYRCGASAVRTFRFGDLRWCLSERGGPTKS
jgi:hypothetical protein